MANAATHFDGMAFTCMSDAYLIESYDTLCERTADCNPNSADWIEEWSACKAEILKRMSQVVE